jgi:phosphate transport system substrate-binding protein
VQSKPFFLVLNSLLGVALLGLSSCAPEATAPTSKDTPTTTSSTPAQTQTAIKVGGSGSTASLLNILATDYEATAKTHKVSQLALGQSENIIEGVKQKIVDCGVISRLLKPAKNDGSLISREMARDALTIALHPSVTGIKNLTTEDIKGIYSGRITNWKQFGGPDAKIVLLDRPEDESAKVLLRKHYLGTDLTTGVWGWISPPP